MKYLASISSIVMVIGIVALPLGKVKNAFAVGCDTYQRISGDIGICKGGTTEYSRQRYIERYSICLQQQLSREIAFYDNNIENYYAEWNKDSPPDRDLETITFKDKNIEPISGNDMQIDEMQLSNQANADLCN